MLRAQGLCKKFGSVDALADFDMIIEPGQIVGLIGPNGSGKTTALKSIMGMSTLDSGSLAVLGLDPRTARAQLMQRTAYIADVGTLPRWMVVADLIEFMASVSPNFDADAARLALRDTDIRINGKVSSLSKGMNVQLHLALLLACQVDLLVLDEPTLGLDLIYRQRFYDAVLNDFYREDRAILVTTHEVREIEHILTHVVFIHRGRAVLTSPTAELSQRFVKLVASLEIESELTQRQPLSMRRTLHGLECIFQNVAADDLAAYGQVSTPNLAELFVAVVEDRP